MHIDTIKQYHAVGNDYLKCDNIKTHFNGCINRNS